MSEKMAIIGAGIMGSAIATRLLDCGQVVNAFDVDAGKVAKLVTLGAEAEISPAEAARRSNFVILSLNIADIVGSAVFGGDGVAYAASKDKLLIDMSSIDPKATAETSAELEDGHGM